MRRFLFLIVLAAAAWFGWKQYEAAKGNPHEAVIVNHSDRLMLDVRLKVGGQAFEKESLPDGERAVFPFRAGDDTSFELVWSWDGAPGEVTWAGGYVPKGPMRQRHLMSVDGDGSVTYLPENK